MQQHASAQHESHEQLQEMGSANSSKALSAGKAEIGESEDNLGQEKKQELNSGNIENEKADGQIGPENPSQEQEQQQEEQQPNEPPFSIFSSSERHFIVIIASLAALFSPLSANIYYPALNTLSEDLHESLSKINLTITTYLVRQLSTSVVTRAQFIADFPRASTGLHREPFRRDRSTAILHDLLHHLYWGKHRFGIASQLSYFARFTYGTELRE